MSNTSGGYFGLGKLISVILALIPGLSNILGVVTRFVEGNIVAGIVRLIITVTGIGTFILWILDLVFIIKDCKIFTLGNIL